MSTFGSPLTSDEDRTGREDAGLFDHWDDGDWDDPADRAEPEPLRPPPEPPRVEGAVCARWVRRRHHGSDVGPCWGRVTAEGGCTKGCVPR